MTSLSDATKEQLNTLGAIMGCDATVFTAGKIKKFMETDPQYHLEQRIRESHGPLRRSLRFLFRQRLIRKRCKGKRIVYEVENWKQLEALYHKLLWKRWLSCRPLETKREGYQIVGETADSTNSGSEHIRELRCQM